jgi:hypothetical protein
VKGIAQFDQAFYPIVSDYVSQQVARRRRISSPARSSERG